MLNIGLLVENIIEHTFAYILNNNNILKHITKLFI